MPDEEGDHLGSGNKSGGGDSFTAVFTPGEKDFKDFVPPETPAALLNVVVVAIQEMKKT